MLSLLDRWDEALPKRRALAADTGVSRTPIADLHVHAPFESRQIFQSRPRPPLLSPAAGEVAGAATVIFVR
ncbi:hypothetical protein [Streptomyces sp. NPDC006446]|uniref:hypothetical protein n=1 Tax=Streptomyces sp. NPDC006446 TaxID=3154301 RepID=UPI0033AC4FE5